MIVPRVRSGFTVLELLTVITVIGALLAILLPAVGSAREAARRMQCTSQLKQVGLALQSYHETAATFPAGLQWESTRASAYGWAVPLLPFLEERAIYEQTDRNALLTDPANLQARSTPVPLLLCPSDITQSTFLLAWEDEPTGTSGPLFDLPTASYFGVYGTLEPDGDDPDAPQPGDGTFIDSLPIRLADLQRGASSTMIVGERTMARVPGTWLGVDRNGADAACRILGNAFTSPNCGECDECEFDSRHPGGSSFLWADGRVSFVSQHIDTDIYRRTSRRSEF